MGDGTGDFFCWEGGVAGTGVSMGRRFFFCIAFVLTASSDESLWSSASRRHSSSSWSLSALPRRSPSNFRATSRVEQTLVVTSPTFFARRKIASGAPAKVLSSVFVSSLSLSECMTTTTLFELTRRFPRVPGTVSQSESLLDSWTGSKAWAAASRASSSSSTCFASNGDPFSLLT